MLSKIFLLLVTLLPLSLFAQEESSYAFCLKFASTPSIETLLTQEDEFLPPNEKQALFSGAFLESAPKHLCYGPFLTTEKAALKAIQWEKKQPFARKNITIKGFFLSKLSASPLQEKPPLTLQKTLSFDLTDPTFVSTLQQEVGSSLQVAVISAKKAYAFSKADAWMPSKSEAVYELEEGQKILSLQQERWCEKNAGCLFWEKAIWGEEYNVVYIPTGNLVYLKDAIIAPSKLWSLFLQPRATLQYLPKDFKDDPKEEKPIPSTSVGLWGQLNARKNLEFFGNIEIPGNSVENLVVSFTKEGVFLEDKEGILPLQKLPIDLSKYPTISPPVKAPEAKKTSTKKKRPKRRYHKVRAGDSLWGLAIKYRTTITAICRANGISRRATLHPGKRLVIPYK